MDETAKSDNSTSSYLNNVNSIQHLNDPNSFDNVPEAIKILDLQRMLIEQKKSILSLKLKEYEDAMLEKDKQISSCNLEIMKIQNNDCILNNWYKSVEEKANFGHNIYQHMVSEFKNASDRLNRHGYDFEAIKSRHKEVISLVDKTKSSFQEKVLSISNSIEDSLKHVNMEKLKLKNEMEILENQHTLEIASFKSNFENVSNELTKIQTEKNVLQDELNDTNIKLTEERKVFQNKIQYFENELSNKVSENVLLIQQNSSINEKFNKLLNEFQNMNDEKLNLLQSMKEKENQLAIQLCTINQQKDQIKNQIELDKLNEELKKNILNSEKHIQYLEKTNANLLEELKLLKMAYNDDQKSKEMKTDYEELLKVQEEKLNSCTKNLELFNANEILLNKEKIELKTKLDASIKTIDGLLEDKTVNCNLIQDLQSKVDTLNNDLNNAYQMLRGSAKSFSSQKNEIERENMILEKEKIRLEKEKFELENEKKEQCQKIERLSSNYMKYKARAKMLHEELMKIRRPVIKPMKSQNEAGITIEILSDDEENKEVNCSFDNFKRNSTQINDISNSNSKKQKMFEGQLSSIKNSENINTSTSSISKNMGELCVSPISIRRKNSLEKDLFAINCKTKNKSLYLNENKTEIEKENICKEEPKSIIKTESNRKQFKIPLDLMPPKKRVVQKKQTRQRNSLSMVSKRSIVSPKKNNSLSEIIEL
ncbi:myosin heavy chain, clone 203-like isoform X2 [Daktulosphaira vitifoliae]|uniref:myosin heavy chain, clone 203-like isoform X2 n=1 Tax=Daktulosphaira vitifoliae TaxID=58002 RepID=UPI0021AAF3A4|nr:myosin heavy chain, clone 203-like isoform X2 [Daktulosphaira vitifoliae]